MNHAEKQRIYKLVGLCANAAGLAVAVFCIAAAIFIPSFQVALPICFALALIHSLWGLSNLRELKFWDKTLRADETEEVERKVSKRFREIQD